MSAPRHIRRASAWTPIGPRRAPRTLSTRRQSADEFGRVRSRTARDSTRSPTWSPTRPGAKVAAYDITPPQTDVVCRHPPGHDEPPPASEASHGDGRDHQLAGAVGRVAVDDGVDDPVVVALGVVDRLAYVAQAGGGALLGADGLPRPLLPHDQQVRAAGVTVGEDPVVLGVVVLERRVPHGPADDDLPWRVGPVGRGALEPYEAVEVVARDGVHPRPHGVADHHPERPLLLRQRAGRGRRLV